MKPFAKPTGRLLALLLLLLAFAGCDAADPGEDGGEEELITRVVLTLTGPGGPVTATARDSDGNTTLDQIEPLVLRAGQTYQGTVQVFNDLETPPDDITEEVEEEDYAHQFVFTPEGGVAARLVVSGRNNDRNGLPLGTTFAVTTSGTTAATGALRVRLRHYDQASPSNTTPKRNDAGDDDVNIAFPVNLLAQ